VPLGGVGCLQLFEVALFLAKDPKAINSDNATHLDVSIRLPSLMSSEFHKLEYAPSLQSSQFEICFGKPIENDQGRSHFMEDAAK
jgi:hypothetical protein